MHPTTSTFTIGETVGQRSREYQIWVKLDLYASMCRLDWLPRREAKPNAAFTTVANVGMLVHVN